MKKSILTLLSIMFLPSLAFSQERVDQVQTRFGLADGQSGTLIFAGKPTKPSISANNSMMIKNITQTKDADYLLLISLGGTACPASYSIVKVTKFNAIPTAFFGNCDDREKVKVINGKSIIISLPTFQSKYSKEAATTIIYDILTGTLKKDGKQFNVNCKNNACEGF